MNTSRKIKSVVVFAIVIAGLFATGMWLDKNNWLEMPNISPLPSFLTGETRAAGPGGAGGEGFGPGGVRDEAVSAQTNSNANAGGAFAPDGRTPPDGMGRGGHESNGLNWDMLPSVLSQLWIIGMVIAVVVYGSKVLSAAMKLAQRRLTRAQVTSGSVGSL